MTENNHLPQIGDVIQTGYRIMGVEEVQWGSHQIVCHVQLNGIVLYRPREAKVDKCAYIWRWPIESKDKIQKDLRMYANPKSVREMIKSQKGPWSERTHP